jgi:hypothetical protein
MEDILTRFFENLAGRVSGPMKFRLVLQPLMAIIFAIKDIRKDAREGQPAYLWALYTGAGHRRDIMKSGWKSVGKVFVLAIVLDAVYQYMQIRWFYPVEAMLVAFILAIIPYVVIRGPISRLMPKKGESHE